MAARSPEPVRQVPRSDKVIVPTGISEVAINAIAPELSAETGGKVEDPGVDHKARTADLEHEAQKRGYEEGFKRGIEAGEREWCQKVESLAQLLKALNKGREDMLVSLEDDIVTLVFEGITRILGDRAVSRQLVHEVVQRTLATNDQGVLIARVSTADFQVLSSELAALAGEGADAKLRLVEDPRVALGGCILEGDRGTLDARLQTQVERLRESLLDARAVESTA